MPKQFNSRCKKNIATLFEYFEMLVDKISLRVDKTTIVVFFIHKKIGLKYDRQKYIEFHREIDKNQHIKNIKKIN